MYLKVLSLVVLLGSVIYMWSLSNVHPDFGLNVKQLIEKYEFPFENHTVTTKDGYILELHRIPHGRKQNAYQKKPPVLLVPGTFSSSADWVNMGENSLGFILADLGYDIWLGNYRGSTRARKHVKLNPDVDREKFWNCSFHEIGTYDLSAFIDYILEVTKQENLYYVGHSQGTISFFVLTSEKPEYNKKIRLMVGLGPAGYFSHTKSPIIDFLARYQNGIQAFVDKFQLYEVLPHSPTLARIAQTVCNDYSPLQWLCASAFNMAAGYSNQLNKTMIPVIVSNSPAGSSFKHWRHASQLYLLDKISKYDYGEKGNLKMYGQSTPPEYNLTLISAPVALYYGTNDIFCVQEDIDRTAAKMQNVIVNKPIPGFNHIDVIWGIDVVKLLFNDFIKVMEEYR